MSDLAFFSTRRLFGVLFVLAVGPVLQAASTRTDASALSQADRLAAQVLQGILPSGTPCEATAGLAARATVMNLQSDLACRVAQSLNHGNAVESRQMLDEAWQEFRAGLVEVDRQYAARLEACEMLGETAYDPVIQPLSFTSQVDHPYFPLPPGRVWTYRRSSADGPWSYRVAVLPETHVVQGVECAVVRVVERHAGEVVEDTRDYFAQDAAGNVWYFGELALQYDSGRVVDIDGSWEAGVNGAKPGMILPARPHVGQTYRHEFRLLEAEDLGTILSVNRSANLTSGPFDQCIAVLDFSPLEQEAETKYYCPGYGLVLEVDQETGERTELVSMESH